MPEGDSQIVRVRLPKDGTDTVTTFSVEIVTPEGEIRVSDKEYGFDDFGDSLESLTKALRTTIQKIAPTKASIEFGIEIGVESGKLTALLVKGSGKANLKVTLEWS
jgi:hypothetical protein